MGHLRRHKLAVLLALLVQPIQLLALDISTEIARTTATSYKKLWTDKVGVSHSVPELEPNEMKVVSYNVLGPLHGEGSKHTYAPVGITKWTRRRDKLIEELRDLKADVLCLQEVSAKGLKETFIPGLRHIGLECCAYAPAKTSTQAKGKYAHKGIGCAIFIRSSKFSMVSSKRVYLRDFAPLEACRSHRLYTDMQVKYNSMAMVALQVKETNQTVCVANTHIYWNPARADIKALQTYAAMDAIEKFCTELGYGKGQQPGMILCGDFNSQPDIGYNDKGSLVSSAPFELLNSGVLESNHPHHPDVWYSRLNDEQGIHHDRRAANSKYNEPVECPRLGPLNVGWGMKNAYLLPEFFDHRPLFTTKTDEFQGWIDHVWVNGLVDVNMVLSPPIRGGDLEANQKARTFGAMPNKNFPSDHLPIGIVATLLR